MRLYHYTETPFVLDRSRVYVQGTTWHAKVGKPVGLWLSAETDDGGGGWKQWCVENEFREDALSCRAEIVLRPDAKILRLSTAADLDAFTLVFRDARAKTRINAIDWAFVARHNQGIVIAPYVWERRLDLMWYYGWDCASACVWDLSAIAEVRGEARPRRALDLREEETK